MAIHAQIIRFFDNKYDFAENFLDSYNFDVNSLKGIHKKMRLGYSNFDKSELLRRIVSALRQNQYNNSRDSELIIEELINRSKKWMSIKIGKVLSFPQCKNPTELLWKPGTDDWYGPVIVSTEPDVRWYIRPVSVKHSEIDEEGKVVQLSIRWLCFARVTNDTISLHWNGFSHAEKEDDAESIRRGNSQFEFWFKVPGIFQELESLTSSKVDFLNLQDIVLQKMMEEFQDSEEFTWQHLKIRAEANGVVLNARAGRINSIEESGLIHLARTLKDHINKELQDKYGTPFVDERRIERVILNTLIREHGALAYEFAHSVGDSTVLHMHVYFGLKPGTPTEDLFPHINVFVTKQSDIEQLKYFLSYARGKGVYDNLEPT
ncbi:hypothetical protein [Herpetosiphon gulosus]|uniref:Uncharacterized protein n=1 Tax=Herpetosiphon gulosus TaxID=1973496 RepID=A0ABP9X9M1_9CHLR